MPKLKIVQDCTGSPDGIHIAEFEAGRVYDVTDHLAPVLVVAGWAVPADDAPEAKAAPAAPENKAATQAPETKAKKAK